VTDQNRLSADHAATILSDMQHRHIVVIGDVMLDTFVDGSVGRISPEAPIPILAHQSTSHMPGGASNVARNLAHLGGQVTLIGVTGDDGARDMLLHYLSEEPAITAHLIADPLRPTTTKTRFMAKGHQLLRVDDELARPINGNSLMEMISIIQATLDNADMVIISDYDKGVIQPPIMKAIISHPKRDMFKVLADPKQPQISLYDGVDILTPNLAEFDRFCLNHNIAIPDSIDSQVIDEIAQNLLSQTSINTMITTLSADGILVSQQDNPPFHSHSFARSVFDVSGAGDTVIALLGAAFSAGASVVDAAILANIAAGIVVAKSGTATVTPGEILAANQQIPPFEPGHLADQIKEWKAQGDRIVFTNGCFDCLHPGHIWLLQTARAKGDRLIVGLNSDASTKRLKGVHRPYQNETDRVSALAALASVDAVIIFEEDTPIELITGLNPDILVKGGDYKADEIIGADHMKTIGGSIEIIALRDGYSTTRLNQS